MHGGGLRYVVYMVAVTALFGAGNVLLKFAYAGMGPLWSGAIRFALACAILFALFGRRIVAELRAVPPRTWAPATFFMVGSFFTAGLSVNFTTATNAGFFFALPMLFTPLFALAAFRKRFGVGTVLLQAAVVAGLYLLCCNGGALSFGLGEAIGLLCSAFYAGVIVFGRKGVQQMDPLALSATQLVFTALAFLVCAAVLEPMPTPAGTPASAWAAIIGLAVATSLAFAFQNLALEKLAPITAAVIVCMEPIFTAALASAFLGEALSGVGLVGAAIIVACSVLSSAVDVDAAFRQLVTGRRSAAR